MDGFKIFLLTFMLTAAPAFAASAPNAEMSFPRKVVHLFNRLAYGPRPGDVQRLTRQGPAGIRRWIEAQLHPETIPDKNLDEKLASLKVPTMSSERLITAFPRFDQIVMKMGFKGDEVKNNPDLQKKIRKEIGPEHLPQEIIAEMTAQRLIRAVESRRQLQEVLADFWLNHFNIDITKGQEKWLLPVFEREVIRKHLFGKFYDLLSATAHSPAMLFYLDNQASQSPLLYLRPGMPPRPRKKGGLNENYAREVMELHTLGVDGGYTQTDVTQLARILTGWSIDGMKADPTFKFRARLHDRGEKTFLGQDFAAEHGIDEGERALRMISHRPATARFISTELARYFVSDHPPQSLVDRMSRAFRKTDGDLRAVYATMFYSPEFWSRSADRAKVKKPVQFVVSAIRSLGGEIDSKSALPRLLAEMGEDLYKCQPPTGYSDAAATWVNPGALVSRLNFASRLSLNRIEGVDIEMPMVPASPKSAKKLVQAVSMKLIHAPLSPSSERVVLKAFEDPNRVMADGEVRPFSLSKAVALTLGSPEFQRR